MSNTTTTSQGPALQSEGAITRFFRATEIDARMLGMLQHRAMVQSDAIVQLDGAWALVMEYVAGVDLKRVYSSPRSILAGFIG